MWVCFDLLHIAQISKRADTYKPEPEHMRPNPAQTRKVIWSENQTRKSPKIWVYLNMCSVIFCKKNNVMLQQSRHSVLQRFFKYALIASRRYENTKQ